MAKNLQLILEISATYSLVGYPLADNWLPIFRLCAQCVISKNNVNSVPCDAVFVFIFFKTVYQWNNYYIRFCDIRNISAFGRADNTHLDLAYSG